MTFEQKDILSKFIQIEVFEKDNYIFRGMYKR